MRSFETGATRDSDELKNDYEGFRSPLVVERFGDYMTEHRQTEGGVRDSDNWQKGIPKDAYMKSGWRHFLDWWFIHRGYERLDRKDGHVISAEEALCALFFNVQGYLHEVLKEKLAPEPEVGVVRVYRCKGCLFETLRGSAEPCSSCQGYLAAADETPKRYVADVVGNRLCSWCVDWSVIAQSCHECVSSGEKKNFRPAERK